MDHNLGNPLFTKEEIQAVLFSIDAILRSVDKSEFIKKGVVTEEEKGKLAFYISHLESSRDKFEKILEWKDHDNN